MRLKVYIGVGKKKPILLGIAFFCSGGRNYTELTIIHKVFEMPIHGRGIPCQA